MMLLVVCKNTTTFPNIQINQQKLVELNAHSPFFLVIAS